MYKTHEAWSRWGTPPYAADSAHLQRARMSFTAAFTHRIICILSSFCLALPIGLTVITDHRLVTALVATSFQLCVVSLPPPSRSTLDNIAGFRSVRNGGAGSLSLAIGVATELGPAS